MARHTITAMFKSRAEAQNAVRALQQDVGLTAASVRMMPEVETASGADMAHDTEDKGFFASLRDLFVPDEDRGVYAEGVRRGDVLVTASVEDSQANRVMDLFEQHGAIDLDEQEKTWRASGWTAETGSGVTGQTASAGVMGGAAKSTMTTGTSAASATARADAGRLDAKSGTETIQLVEERLLVGKRDVSHGRVRIRSYVVETPVSEQVHLRNESVSIERHPVDRAVGAGDDVFRERTIEATEHSEEAVVTKEARVREELTLRKDVGERVETVTDKVRRTEVEVEGKDGVQTGATGARVDAARDGTRSGTDPLLNEQIGRTPPQRGAI